MPKFISLVQTLLELNESCKTSAVFWPTRCIKKAKDYLNGRIVNACASCGRGLEFKSQASQIFNSIANGLLPLQHLRK